jgi:hypothetical protein
MNTKSIKWAKHIARVGTAEMHTEPYFKTLKKVDHLKVYA